MRRLPFVVDTEFLHWRRTVRKLSCGAAQTQGISMIFSERVTGAWAPGTCPGCAQCAHRLRPYTMYERGHIPARRSSTLDALCMMSLNKMSASSQDDTGFIDLCRVARCDGVHVRCETDFTVSLLSFVLHDTWTASNVFSPLSRTLCEIQPASRQS